MRLIPTDERYFELFSDLVAKLSAAAALLQDLFAEPHRAAELAARIKELEHEADRATDAINARLDRTFITPFDREDIHALAGHLDDVVDLVDGTARRATVFRIREVQPAAVALAEVLGRASRQLEASVRQLQSPHEALDRVRLVKTLEEEGDALYQQAVTALFAGSPDPIEVMKWKELYDHLEQAIDECNHASQIVESVALKHA